MANRGIDDTKDFLQKENPDDDVDEVEDDTASNSSRDIACFQGAQVVLSRQEVEMFLRARKKQIGYIDDELRLVLIGKTGVGKSATGNTILGEAYFKSEFGGSSVTKKCIKKHSRILGRDILVVDTPGIFDTETDPSLLQDEIRKCIKMASPGPHAILFVMRLSDRYKKEDYEALTTFCSYFGEKMLDHVIAIFTHADIIQAEQMTLSEYIENSPTKLKELLKLFGNRKIAFNNKFDKFQSQPQVEGLMTMVDALKSVGLTTAYYVDRNFEIAEEEMQRKGKEIESELQKEYKVKTEEFRKQCLTTFDKEIKKIEKHYEEKIIELRKTLREEKHLASMQVRGFKLPLHQNSVEKIPKPFTETNMVKPKTKMVLKTTR